MKAIEFPEVNLRIAENQPQYETLPAYVGPVPCAPAPGGCPICGAPEFPNQLAFGTTTFQCGSSNYDPEAGTIDQGQLCKVQTVSAVTFCMELNKDEIAEVIRTGRIWHTVLTFGQPLQPVSMSTSRPAHLDLAGVEVPKENVN